MEYNSASLAVPHQQVQERNHGNSVQKKTVLITGCSTGGIGWAMAKIFHARGFHVFATARDASKAADLSEPSSVEILELDVTVPETISQCKDTCRVVVPGGESAQT